MMRRLSFWGRWALVAGAVLALAGLPSVASAQEEVLICDQAELEAAITNSTDGAIITFACDGNLVITNTIRITRDITIDGSEHFVTLTGLTGTNATNGARFFTVDPEVSLTLINLRLFNGYSTNGGAIYVGTNAVLEVIGCVFSNNVAIGSNGVSAASISTNSLGRIGKNAGSGTPGITAHGGAIYNLGEATFTECVFLTNTVAGGHGGDGGSGGAGTILPGKGGSGGRGGAGLGGAIYNAGILTLTDCAFYQNIAVGGFGGLGGAAGTGQTQGAGGKGGAGGGASGAAVFNQRFSEATIESSTFALNGTSSGDSGSAAAGARQGARGPNGPDTSGGAVANFGTNTLENCTFFGNVAFAGSGGDGGSATLSGGRGGNGGVAWGGNVFNARRATLKAIHCTFSDGGATGGTNGVGGAAQIPGKDGGRGASRGGNIANSNGVFQLHHSILAYANPGTNAWGKFKGASYNLSSDKSIKFDRRITNFANIDPLLDIPRKNGGLVETIELLPGSPAIDKGQTNGPLAVDARGVPRPLGNQVDLGAYESGQVLGPPRITVQPVDRAVLADGSVVFSVVAWGDAPLLYQWQLDGEDIDGANASTYTLDGASQFDEGEYTVVVANNSGTVLSEAATLDVLFPPDIVEHPEGGFADSGGSFALTVTVEGDEPFTHQWFKNDQIIPGAVLSSFFVINAQSNLHNGFYHVRVCNPYKCVESDSALVIVADTPPVITSMSPTNQTVAQGATARFTANTEGSRPASYFWWFNGSIIRSVIGTNVYSDTLTITNTDAGDIGDYFVVVTNNVLVNGVAVSVTSGPVRLEVQTELPQIIQQPFGVTVRGGDPISLFVGVTGSEPLHFRWFQNSNVLSGVTTPDLVFTNAQGTNTGFYHVIVSNLLGSVTSVVASVSVQTQPPSIITQPTSRTVLPGQNVTFSAQVSSGSGPYAFQWFFNGTTPVGGNSATLTLSNVQATNSGSYTLRVTNLLGSVTSSAAILTVQTNPVAITTQPVSQSAGSGQNVTFSVVATGDGPLVYQWYFNATNRLTGRTNSTLTLTSVQPTNAGAYHVVVSNLLNSATSAVATLTVQTAGASILTDPTNASVFSGEDVTLSVVAAGSTPLFYQWYFNGATPVANATNAVLSFLNAQPAVSGNYHVSVSNGIASATSAIATVTVTDSAPVITVGHTDFDGNIGTDATFSVTATGSRPLGFQWYQFVVDPALNIIGTNTLAGTTAILLVPNVQGTNEGFYRVVVTNSFGTFSSEAYGDAVLNVLGAGPIQP